MDKNKDKNNYSTSSEKPAVKTTIVGGRPPGSGKESASVPRGIEILVKKASVDSDFKEALLKERAAAACRIDLSLEKSEISILNNIPQPHLEGMISATKVSPNMKQIFLGYTAAVMLAALTVTACASERDYGTRGISPDDVGSRGMRPDVIEYQKTPAPPFRKWDAPAKIENGTLEVKAIDEVNGLPIPTVTIRLLKRNTQDTGNQNVTIGWGHTNRRGVYRLEGIPAGKYFIEVTRDSSQEVVIRDREYYFVTQEVEIIANKENLVIFKLQRK